MAKLELEERHSDLGQEVKKRTAKLESMNAALEILLEKRENDRSEIERNIFANFELSISPTMEYLKKNVTQKNNLEMLSILESELEGIISPFSKKISNPMLKLTPMEIRVVNMVKQGKTNKEISEILSKSVYTIANHRENIRTKLGLKNTGTNLRSYLSELQ